MKIIPCTLAHLDAQTELFNAYRIFYQLPDDLTQSRAFIAQNLSEGRSKIFMLTNDDGEAVAFAQLYPAICSLAMRQYYYLSDLYVKPSARRSGHARSLMDHLTQHFRQTGAQRLTLDTAHTNVTAQRLYESLGYQTEKEYITYHLVLDPGGA